MRRTRRRTGVWLPASPYNAVQGPAVDPATPIVVPNALIFKEVILSINQNRGDSTTVSVPVVGDLNEDLIAGIKTADKIGDYEYAGSLADVGVGYSIKRIVGKIFASMFQYDYQDTTASTRYVFSAGLIVRRVDDTGEPLAADAGENFVDTYNAIRDPYIWRRQWVLENTVEKVAQAASGYYNFAPGNYAYGSVADGPHVDVKTRRTVKLEERLFLDLTVSALNGEAAQLASSCLVYWDLRVFGRIFQSAGNRRNASR